MTEIRIEVLEYMGHWNGYCGIPKDHPFYGLSYYSEELTSLDVHGGVTYSDKYLGIEKTPGEQLWWIGFDTAHFGDEEPKSKEYVEREVLKLKEQLVAAWNTENKK